MTPSSDDPAAESARLRVENEQLADLGEVNQQRAARVTEVNELLVESMHRLSTDADLELFLESLVRVLADRIVASPVMLFEYDAAANTLAMRIHYDDGEIRRGPSGAEVPLFAAPFPADITPAWAGAVREGGRFLTETGERGTEGYAWPGLVEWMQRIGVTEPGFVALVVGRQPVGGLGISWKAGRRSKPEDFPLVEALARQAAVGLQLVKLADEAQKNAVAAAREKEARERVVELARANEALHRSTASLLRQDDANEFLGKVLHDACAGCGAASAGILRYDEASGTVRVVAFVAGGKSVNLETDPRFGFWRGSYPTSILPGWDALRSGEISWFDNEDPNPERWSAVVDWHRSMGHRIVGIIPMLVGETFLGFLGLCFAGQVPPTPSRFEQAHALAGHAGLALQLARLTDDLRCEIAERAALAERNRIARDLHDTLAQGFTGILAQLGVIEGALEIGPGPAADDSIRHALARAVELARSSLVDARRSTGALRSAAADGGVPDLSGEPLGAKLQTLLERMTNGTRLRVRLVVEPAPLPAPVEETLCRIALEALTNSLRHGGPQATEFYVRISCGDGCVRLVTRDNGCGFDLEKATASDGFGLVGMRERAEITGGRVEFCSAPGEGMTITVEIPIAPSSASLSAQPSVL